MTHRSGCLAPAIQTLLLRLASSLLAIVQSLKVIKVLLVLLAYHLNYFSLAHGLEPPLDLNSLHQVQADLGLLLKISGALLDVAQS